MPEEKVDIDVCIAVIDDVLACVELNALEGLIEQKSFEELFYLRHDLMLGCALFTVVEKRKSYKKI